MYKKIIAVFSAIVLVMTGLTACNKTPEKASGSAANSSSVVSSQSGSSSDASSQSNTSSSQSAASSAVSSSSQIGASSFPVPEKDPLYVKAYGYYAKDEYDLAVSVSNQALAKDKNCFWAYNIKGIATYFANGNSVGIQCLNLIDKSTAIDPYYSYGYFNKGLILKGLKRWSESIANFNKVLSLKPGDTWSYYGIATVYADSDQVDLALKYLKLAIDTNPSAVKPQVQDDMVRHFSRMKNDERFKALVD